MADESDKIIQMYVKEKNAARAETEKCNKEIKSLQVKLYDLNMKYSELQIKVMEDKEKRAAIHEKSKNNKSSPSKTTSSQSKPQRTRAQKASAEPKPGTLHPIIPNHEAAADNPSLFYKTIGQLCPNARLSVVLQAEKLFLEADTNGNGIIDIDELDTLFTKHLALYTRGQVEEILSSIDSDSSGLLDFMEILEVMDKMDHGEKQDLPKEIRKNAKGSLVCSVQ